MDAGGVSSRVWDACEARRAGEDGVGGSVQGDDGGNDTSGFCWAIRDCSGARSESDELGCVDNGGS